jgi:glucan-binding YG repeat protein/DNA repair exonuclease SbcCD ATPase subunit
LILKTFQGQSGDWKSFLGVGNKSFRQYENNVSGFGYNVLPSFITDKIVTKNQIKGQLKDTSIYDNFDANGLLTKIRDVDEKVQAGAIHWSDYYKTLDGQPELSWVKDFIQSNDLIEVGLDDVIAAQEKARLEAVNYNNALKSTLTTTKLMGAAMKVVSFAGNMLIGAGISLAVEAAIKGIDNLIHHSEKLIEAGKQADENISNAISSYQEKVSSIQDLGKQVADNPSSINTTAKAIDSLAEKYTKLHLGVKADGSNSTLSTDEYSEFLNISNQLADLFPSLKVGTDEQGNALLNLGTNASATARQLQDLVDVQKTLTHSEIVDNANDSYAGMMEQIKDYNNQISDLENKQEDYTNYNPTTSLSSVSKSIENGYLTLRGLSNEEVDKVKKAIADNFKEFDDENDVNATSTWEDGDYIVTINLADQVSKTERKSKSSQVSDAISAYLKDNTANVKIESNEVNAQKKALEAQKQQLISEFASNTVTPYLQTTSVLSNFDSELMAALTNNAKNFDYSSIESEYGGDVDEMLRQKIVVPLQQLKPDAQDALRDALNLNPDDLSTNDYTKQINKYLSKVSSDKDVQDSWKKTFGLNKIIEEATSESDSLVEAFGDSYKNKINKLSGEDRNLLYSITIEDSAFDGTWQDAMNKLDELKNKSEETSESFDLSSFATNATKHINAISNITSALSESKSGTGLSLAAEVDDETGAVSLSGSLKNLQDIYMDLKDETGEPLFKNSAELSEALLERTANGIHVNKEALQELQDLEEKQTKTDFLKQQTELQKQLNEQLEKEKQLREENKTNTEEYNSVASNIDSLKNQLDTVQNLASAYDGATSAYNKWIQAQSGGNERDNYENIAKGYDSAKAAIEQGWYGDDSLNKYLDMMLSKDKRTGDAKKDFSQLTKKIKGTNHNLMDYWRYDENENLVTDGLFDFLDDAKKTLGDEFVQIDKDGAYSFDFTGDKLQQVADYFHTTTDVVEMFSKALIDAGATVKMEDNDTSLDGIAQKLKEASEAADKSRNTLEKLKQSGDITTTIDFNADVSSMDTDAIDNRITELQNLKNKLEVKFGVDSSEVSAVDDLLEEANARKQQLELESKCNVTVDINGDEDLEELKTKLADLPENENSNVTVSVHNEDQMDNVIQEIQQVPDNTPVTFSFNVDNQDQADALQAKIDKLQSEDSNKTFKYSIQVTDESKDVGKGNDSIINVEAKVKGKEKVDELKSSIEALKDKNVNVRAKVDKGQLDGLSAQLAGLKDKNINITTTTTNVTVPSSTGSPYAQPASLSGNKGKPKKKRATGSFAVAHASGTAYNVQNYKRLTPAHAAGDVSLKQNETALVNEEYLNGHSESIVRDGVWSLIPGGAHVENLKRGDIIFSAKQTDDLLRTGATPGHARAYANGTVDISGAYGASGVNGKRRKNSGKSTSKTSKNSSSSKSKTKTKSSDKSTNANTKATDSNTQATEDNTDAQENLQDWISRLCDVSKDWNDSFKNAIDQFEMNYNQNKAIDEYVANSESYKNTLRNSANNYMSRANSLGLSGDYIHKIWTGTMDIENITDENVRDKIEKYTEWYDKARDLNSEIADLNKSIRETKIQKLDNIKDDYDNLVSLSTSISDYNESVSDLSEKLTGVGDANALHRSANAQVAIRQALVNSEAQLNAQLNALVADGTIGMYTDTWNKWQEEINGVKKSIIEADEALNDLKKSIMEVRFNNFTKAIDNLDFQSDMSSAIQDLLLEEGIYDDDVKITSTGYTKLGLLGTDLVNAKQKVADYNEAIRALKENYKQGNISQADFNEQLQEYQKDQMDAVSATKTARDAIIDLIKDGIEKETDAMDELISKRKDDLDKQKEYYDFQKKMNDQSKDMNKVRAQLAALEGDDSLEATAKRRKLESQLKDLQEQYDEDQKDHEKDVVSDAYDKTLEDFKKNQEDTVKELESSLEKQNQAISNALEATKNNYNDVYTILTELSNQYNFSLTQDLVSPWQSAQAALQQYQDSIGKLNANISSIDTSKITTAQPSQASTVPTKNESKYVTTKNQNGTWLNQDGRWWYQHNDGGWKNDGWESIDGQWYKFDREGWMQTGWQPWGTDSTGNAAWYYLTDSGAMARSTWIAGANGAQYYVDSTGVMARNGYVRSADGSKYYWVNADGVWEPSWTTTAPNLSKYKLYYSTGTPKAKDQLAFMDDKNGKLSLGSEAMITDKGVLGNWGGNVIFSKDQTQALYNMSKGIFPGMDQMIKNVKANAAPVNITNNVSQGDINVHYDSLVTVQGDVNKDMFPGIQKMAKESFDYTIKELKKANRALH